MKKKIITITAAVLIFAFGVMAAPAIQTITAQLRPDLKVVIDGVEQEFYDAAGTQVYPVLYNGTTYLPLRAIGSSLGMSVDWNQDKFTATLTSDKTAEAPSAETEYDYVKGNIDVSIHSYEYLKQVIDWLDTMYVDSQDYVNEMFGIVYLGIALDSLSNAVNAPIIALTPEDEKMIQDQEKRELQLEEDKKYYESIEKRLLNQIYACNEAAQDILEIAKNEVI